jgi:hypothetical protein
MHKLHGKRRSSRQVPRWVRTDGGRRAAGVGALGDCSVRAVAVATGKPYCEVHAALVKAILRYVKTRRTRVAKWIKQSRGGRGFNPSYGCYNDVVETYLKSIGWEFTPTKGRKIRLRADELPSGRLIVWVSGHFTAVVDGVIHDTFNSAGAGQRPVKGYYIARAS